MKLKIYENISKNCNIYLKEENGKNKGEENNLKNNTGVFS